MATLKLKRAYEKGGASYGIDGVRGSIYLNKSMLAGDPPAEIEVPEVEGSPIFATPTAGGGKVNDPERAAKMADQAAKAQARADKAVERAKKLAERAAKAGGVAVPSDGSGAGPAPEAVGEVETVNA